ncbi:hypothetical protein V2J09_007530, partial [Rumex salicifolius]
AQLPKVTQYWWQIRVVSVTSRLLQTSIESNHRPVTQNRRSVHGGLRKDMASRGEARARWSVFDGVKFLPGKPDALMAEINTAISAIEYARATAFLSQTPPSSSSSLSTLKNKSQVTNTVSVYNARESEEAYRIGCLSMGEGKLNEALHSFKTSLSKCPPDRTEAVSKIQSLISVTSLQLQKSSK